METEHYPVPCSLGDGHVVSVTYARRPEVIIGLHCTCDDVGESVERLGGLACMTTLQELRTYLRFGVAAFGSPLSDETHMNILYSQISRVRVAVTHARDLGGRRGMRYGDLLAPNPLRSSIRWAPLLEQILRRTDPTAAVCVSQGGIDVVASEQHWFRGRAAGWSGGNGGDDDFYRIREIYRALENIPPGALIAMMRWSSIKDRHSAILELHKRSAELQVGRPAGPGRRAA